MYRAIGEGGLSVFGYASSKNGIHIDERSETPAYALKEAFLNPLQKPMLLAILQVVASQVVKTQESLKLMEPFI